MPPFKVHAPYVPMGDQPRAIEQLVGGAQRGLRQQTLLGATGTGKSLGALAPVFIAEQQGERIVSQVLPIGQLIDRLMQEAADLLRYDGDTAILDAARYPAKYYAQSFNPDTGKVDLYPIQAFTRHSAPERMYRIQTACGRSATLTGDHNLWVLRDGRLQLIETADARATDYVPLPEKLLAEGELASLNLLSVPEVALAVAESGGSHPRMADATTNIRMLDHKPFVYSLRPQGIRGWLDGSWSMLTNAALAKLLQDYFDRYGAVESAEVVLALDSAEIASHLAYALFRFGIQAYMRPSGKAATNTNDAEDCSYRIAIFGQNDLLRFTLQIGFSNDDKQSQLEGLLARGQGSDSVLPPIDGSQLRWTPLVSLEPVEYEHHYVYDFSVPGAETFLAGEGGLFVHNTYVMAQVVEQLQRPTLVMAHNKTLAAQLFAEFKEFFPDNAVSYFVSYYDTYTPEAYVPSKDLYIEKEASINEEIDRLRHEATQSLLVRPDVLIVASVSAIYGLGSPADYGQQAIPIRAGEVRNRDKLLRQLIDLQFERNDIDFHRGTFRVRGDTLEIFPANAETALRVEFWGDEVERIVEVDPLTGELLVDKKSMDVYPAKHFITTQDKLRLALGDIERELEQRLGQLEEEGKQLEAARLKQRTMYDLEMLGEMGYCSGIENYSRHLDRRAEGQTPWTLLDYFPDDFLMFIDESHISVPQIRGMFNGDRSRKMTLVDYGFRLPSALDNRPLHWEEFERHIHQVVYVSATPGPYELAQSEQVVEQIIRPTGLIDPVVQVRPSRGQVDDLLGEVKLRVDKGQRALVTTLTKRMAEDLADYLKEMGVRTHYLHADIETIERVEILRDLRLGIYDVVVGINLLREGLDLPEVSLVAILDADKEGFLRSEQSLIQITGRAARHVEGTVIMYADNMTRSMQAAIQETDRRRTIQEAYNREHGIEPQGIVKEVRDLTNQLRRVAEEQAPYQAGGVVELPKDELLRMIKELEKQMKEAARNLEFEKAALLRDQLVELRRTLALEDETLLLESVSHQSRPARPLQGGQRRSRR